LLKCKEINNSVVNFNFKGIDPLITLNYTTRKKLIMTWSESAIMRSI
jgi:hypothetical protein